MANEQNLKPFEKDDERINREGRPKKFVSQVLADLKEKGYENVSRSQIVDIYETLLALSEDELLELGNDKEQPMIYRIIARAMLSKRGFDIIERMVDRAQGRPTQPLKPDGDEPFPIALVKFEGDEPHGETTRKPDSPSQGAK